MNLRRLEYFVAVAEYLNFRKAAEALYVTQPLLSRQISELEEELGQTLFFRNTRTVMLTPAGELLYKETADLLNHANIVQQRIKHFQFGDHIGGHLRLGLEDGFDPRIVTNVVQSLRHKYPQIDISLNSFSFLDITNALKENVIDIGFVLLPDKKFSPNLDCKLLRQDPQFLIASKNRIHNSTDQQAFIDVAEQECLFLLEKNPKFINNSISICIELDIAAEFRYVSDISQILLYIESGYGAAALPSAVYDTFQRDGLSSYKIPQKSTYLCLAAVWDKNSLSAQGSLLLEELNYNGCNCKNCSISWCCFYQQDAR